MSEKMKIENLDFNIEDLIVVFVEKNEKVADINQKGCNLLEYQKFEVVGKNWFELFIPQNIREETRISFHELLNGTLRKGRDERRILTKNNQERIIAWYNLPVKDENGDFVGAMLSGQDVTERKQFEERSIRLASFPSFDPNPIVEVDFDGKITYTNPATKKVFSNLEKRGLDQPFFVEWEKISASFKDKISEYSFGREV